VLPSFDLQRLPGEWRAVHGTPDGSELEAELTREVSFGHTLSGTAAVAVCVKRHRKDAIFWLPERGEWAWVHLTYAVEADPRWPRTVLAHDWHSIVAETTAD
jgi:hypothetical protein